MGLTPAETRDRLQAYLARWAAAPVAVDRLEKLAGGAIQENWRFDLYVGDGPWKGRHDLVLRRDAPSAVAASHGRMREYLLLKAAHEAGVAVPEPVLACDDADVLGGPFFVMRRVPGEAAGHRLSKRPADQALARALGRELAKIHLIRPGGPAAKTLDFLAPLAGPASAARIEQYRGWLDDLGDPRPAIEWGLRRLELSAPAAAEVVLCHRDFRTGNYMADGSVVTGILDWEFAGWGEREEDIGWFCARCWRFAAPEREAGGIAARRPFYEAYEEAAGHSIDAARVAWWETMAHVRWAVIACQQAARYLKDGEASLELALTAHVVPELELEVLRRTEEAA